MPPLVFISCGQFTPDEVALGNEVERLIRTHTPYEPYFAEQQNTLDGLVTNIFSALNRAAAFVGIMHHRGSLITPTSDPVIRGSVWVEQELAICAFMQHVLRQKCEVALYLQRGITREGVRAQLRLKPVEFDTANDVLDDLRNRVPTWALKPVSRAPLIARWQWKLQPGYSGQRHEYKLAVQLHNESNTLIKLWKAELWFPSGFIVDTDRTEPFVHFSNSSTNSAEDSKWIWPGGQLPVFGVPYVITAHNWPGWLDDQHQAPKVRLRVSTENAEPWEEEFSIMDIQQF